LEKDLANAKTLARILEEEYAALRKYKVPVNSKDGPIDAAAENGEGVQQDVAMMESEVVEDDVEDMEPKENGSAAVERRIEKVMAELRESGVLDASDEEVERRKVRLRLVSASIPSVHADVTFAPRPWFRSICIWLTFVQPFTLAIIAQLLPIILRNCSANVSSM